MFEHEFKRLLALIIVIMILTVVISTTTFFTMRYWNRMYMEKLTGWRESPVFNAPVDASEFETA
jgi:hypothetical protein